MSITLDYITIEPVSAQVSVRIAAEADTLLTSFDWWAEPIHLEHRKADQRLEGDTRIRLGGYGMVDVPADEEALMVCRDTSFIVSTFTQWSRKYKVSWRFSEVGTDVGSIVNGVPSAKLTTYVAALCENLKLPLSKVPEVLKKHEGRKE